MGSLYDQIKQGNEGRSQRPITSFNATDFTARKGLNETDAQRFSQYLTSESGREFTSWEAQALNYLKRMNQLEGEFQKAFTADLTDATSKISKFRGALNTLGKPAVIKYNSLIWAAILTFPFIVAGIFMVSDKLQESNETGTVTAIESTHLLMMLLPIAAVLAILYPFARKMMMIRAANKALRKTGLSAKAASNTISYHRSLYGFYFMDGNEKAMTNEEFVARIYKGDIDLDSAQHKQFAEDSEYRPEAIRDFLKAVPQTLPTSFPVLEAPRMIDYRRFPKESEAATFLKNNQQLSW